jgi:ribosomal protein S18 acetylase RimI-like enzyme
MKQKLIETLSEYEGLIKQFASNKPITNDYMQAGVVSLIENKRLFEAHTHSNLFFFVKKDVGHRVYYYLNDLTDTADFADMKDLVIEILFRSQLGMPQQEIDYFTECGFAINLIRDQYACMYKDMAISAIEMPINVTLAETINDVECSCNLFNESFDKLSGDFIPESEYQSLLTNNQILIAKDTTGRICGALHQTCEKNIAWISHVAVTTDARGKHVGSSLVKAYIQHNYTTEKQRYMCWVQRQNIQAVNMYKKMGFKYLQKSTISLIK